MKLNKHVKLGDLEIPVDYFNMSKEDKEVLCNVIMDGMLTVLDRGLKSDIDRIEIFDKILESSIITNQEQEEYEICQVLVDIRTLMNE
jgi:hypothetical protein